MRESNIKNKIKLIALDLDGTTLNAKGQFSNRTKEAFAAAMAKDIHIVISTGKMGIRGSKTGAEHFFWMEYPFVYRVHEKPDVEKMVQLKAFLSGFGISLAGNPDNIHPNNLNDILLNVEGKPFEKMCIRDRLKPL